MQKITRDPHCSLKASCSDLLDSRIDFTCSCPFSTPTPTLAFASRSDCSTLAVYWRLLTAASPLIPAFIVPRQTPGTNRSCRRYVTLAATALLDGPAVPASSGRNLVAHPYSRYFDFTSLHERIDFASGAHRHYGHPLFASNFGVQTCFATWVQFPTSTMSRSLPVNAGMDSKEIHHVRGHGQHSQLREIFHDDSINHL